MDNDWALCWFSVFSIRLTIQIFYKKNQPLHVDFEIYVPLLNLNWILKNVVYEYKIYSIDFFYCAVF